MAITGASRKQAGLYYDKGGEVRNIMHPDYGAVGDGVTDNTTRIQAAIDDAITDGASRIVIPPSPAGFVSGNLQLADAIDVEIGGGGKILWTGSTGSEVGFELVGTCDGVTFRDLRLRGDGVVANAHRGIWNASGQTLSDIKALNLDIRDVCVGVSANADLGGSIDGYLVQGCYLDNIVGTASGSGYGIHHANGSTNPSNFRAIGNTISRAQRHSIYQAKGYGWSLIGNTIKKHRLGVSDLSFRVALNVARSFDGAVIGNTVMDGYDGMFKLGADLAAGIGCGRISVLGNIFSRPQNLVPPVVIGSTDPATEGTPEAIVFKGNLIVVDGIEIPPMRVYSALHSIFRDNILLLKNITTSLWGIDLVGQSETGGSASWTDDNDYEGNKVYGTVSGAGKISGFRMSIGTATGGGRIGFARNRVAVAGGGTTFSTPTAITNTNIEIDRNHPTDGLTFSAGVGISNLVGTMAADRGDANISLFPASDREVQLFATALTANRTVSLSSTGATKGKRFRVVRTGLGAFTLNVGGLKTIPSATAAFVDVEHDGTAWRLTGYGTL